MSITENDVNRKKELNLIHISLAIERAERSDAIDKLIDKHTIAEINREHGDRTIHRILIEELSEEIEDRKRNDSRINSSLNSEIVNRTKDYGELRDKILAESNSQYDITSTHTIFLFMIIVYLMLNDIHLQKFVVWLITLVT